MEHERVRATRSAPTGQSKKKFQIITDVGRGESDQDIERVWISPNGKTCAYAIRQKGGVRRLYVAGRLFFEGIFHAGEEDFVWAQNGVHFGLHVHETDSPYQDAYILTSASEQYDVPRNSFLREYLIDDEGRLAAWIVSDGEECFTQIYERDFRNFSVARGLHWTNFGSIAFEAVRDGQTLHITDETELPVH